MAITHLSLTNQKLAYAGRLLALAAGYSPGQSRTALELQALLASALMHLALAHRFYLRELGENYQLKLLAGIQSAKQLQELLAQASRSPAEADELLQLELDTNSWLAQLLAAARALEASPVVQVTPKAFARDDQLISLVEIAVVDEPNPAPLRHEVLAQWLEIFRQLVLRQRQTSAEY